MKTNYLLFFSILFLFNVGITVGQNLKPCGTEATSEQIAYSNSLRQARSTFQRNLTKANPDSIPVTVHIIRRNNGSGGVSETDVTNSFADLNADFLAGDMLFLVCGDINYIDDSEFFDFDQSEESALGNIYDVPNTINLYIPNTVADINFTPLCGYSYLPPSADRVLISSSCLNNGTTLSHEIGHYFSLYHTHGKFNCGALTGELVDGSNCATAGDDVCDTPAEPNLLDLDCQGSLVDAQCNYIGTYTDSTGAFFNPNTNNIMSYAPGNCVEEFTAGQFDRMIFAYQNSRNNLDINTCIGDGCVAGNTLIDCEGTFSDGSFLGNYLNNQECSWLIQPENADQIILNFSEFETEAGIDAVKVFDGPNDAAPLIGNFSGSQIPNELISSGGSLYVRFNTNGNTTFSGWKANYACYTPVTGFCNGTTLITDCNGSFTDGSGELSYAPNSDCRWLLQIPDAEYITLNFSQLNIEPDFDQITVYDGNNTAAPVLAQFSGFNPPGNILSSSNEMLVQFTTDGSTELQGFTANFTCSDEPLPSPCSGFTEVRKCSGTLTDGGGTNDYNNFSDCTWLIQPTAANYIVFEFTEFETEETLDFVELYDGTSTADPLIGRYSGTTYPTGPIVSSTGALFVRFFADGSVTRSGWTADYRCGYDDNFTYCDAYSVFANCLDSITDGSGEQNYTNNSNCSWLIAPEMAETIHLSFPEFNLGAGDSLRIFDGDTSTAPLLANFSSSNLPSPFSSTGDQLFIQFYSDGSQTGAGWQINYECIPDTTFGYCNAVDTITDCIGTLGDASGLESYENRTHCTWLLQPEIADQIEIAFTHVDISNPGDTLKIYDGDNRDSTLIIVLTDTIIPDTIISTYGMVFLEFKTDSVNNAGGWSLNYSCSYTPPSGPCQNAGLIRHISPTGVISDGPEYYSDLSNCEWLIQPNNASSIQLVFSQFYTERNYDFLEIYDGKDTTAPLLESLTGFQGAQFVPDPITSSGGALYIRLLSDESINYDGFVASYSTTVGLTEYQEISSFRLFPNPNNGDFKIELEALNTTNASLSIYNISGRLVQQEAIKLNAGRNQYTVSMDGNAMGVYFVQIKTVSGISSKKIVVQPK